MQPRSNTICTSMLFTFPMLNRFGRHRWNVTFVPTSSTGISTKEYLFKAGSQVLAWTPVTCFDSLPTMPFSGPGNGREKERGCGKGLAWGQGCRSNDRPVQQNAAHTRGRVDYSDLVLNLRCYPPPVLSGFPSFGFATRNATLCLGIIAAGSTSHLFWTQSVRSIESTGLLPIQFSATTLGEFIRVSHLV